MKAFFYRIADALWGEARHAVRKMRDGVLISVGIVAMLFLYSAFATNPYSWQNDSGIQNLGSGTVLTHGGWNTLVNNVDYLSGQLAAGISGGGSPAAFSNLKIVAGGSSIAVTAGSVTVTNSAGATANALNVNANISTTATAGQAGAIDTESSWMANSWFYVWVIYNGTTSSAIASISSTNPILPSGYTYAARV